MSAISQPPGAGWRTRARYRSYLTVTAVVVGSFGPVFALGSELATSGPAAWTLDLLDWPLDGQQDYAAQTTRFLSAVAGGFLLGWGLTIYALRAWVYDSAPEGVRRSVVVGLVAWFVLDSVGSVAAGAPSNVVGNVIVLLLAVGPMWWPAVDAGSSY